MSFGQAFIPIGLPWMHLARFENGLETRGWDLASDITDERCVNVASNASARLASAKAVRSHSPILDDQTPDLRARPLQCDHFEALRRHLTSAAQPRDCG